MHVCSFTTVDDVTIVIENRSYRFEFSEMFGPVMLGKRGQILGTIPGVRSPFWAALHAWVEQGYRRDGTRAVYDLRPKPTYVRLVGRHYTLVPEGRDPQDVRRTWFEKMGLPVPEDAPELVRSGV